MPGPQINIAISGFATSAEDYLVMLNSLMEIQRPMVLSFCIQRLEEIHRHFHIIWAEQPHMSLVTGCGYIIPSKMDVLLREIIVMTHLTLIIRILDVRQDTCLAEHLI